MIHQHRPEALICGNRSVIVEPMGPRARPGSRPAAPTGRPLLLVLLTLHAACGSGDDAAVNPAGDSGVTAGPTGGVGGRGGGESGGSGPNGGAAGNPGSDPGDATSSGGFVGGGPDAGPVGAGDASLPISDAGDERASLDARAGMGDAEPSPALMPGAWGDQGDGTFKNPVLFADYNNLDVIAAEGEFHMIAASHHFMGMPVLRSHDMVNWTLVSRIYRGLDLDPRYDQPGQAYQHGSWAPAIRYHEGRYWVYVTTPVEGLIMTTATTTDGPWAPWTVVRKVAGWEDPCPYWDDVDNAGGDGPSGRRAYLVRSQLGAGPIIVQPMSWDGKTLLGTPTTVATGPTLEGPKLHKHNGIYYIFAPEGGIDNGYQVVLRANQILGPYTKKTILERGSTAVNGPHQGSWIDLAGGQSWFYHFQQNAGWGRVAHLQPAQWGSDGWPKIGVDLDGNGIGEPVAQPRKPDVGAAFPLGVPQSSDEFDGPALGLQWLWNHNPDNAHWSLGARPGWLRLSAQALASKSGTDGTGGTVRFQEDSVVFAYNTLVQLAMGKLASAVTRLDTTGMVDGQRAGITLFGQTYGWIGVVQTAGQRALRANLNGTYTNGPALSAATVFLKASIDASSRIAFAYSLDGQVYTPLGGTVAVGRTWFEGIKFGLFTYNLSTAADGGVADFDFFRYRHDGPHTAN